MTKKYLGLDLGTNSLGIAKSDILGFVHGVENLHFDKNQYVVARKRVHQIVKETGITNIVIGYPLHLNGEKSQMSENVERFVEDLKKEYEKVYLVRNERQLVIYSFDAGERCEPDYLMILCRKNATGFDQYQIFVEPKGDHLLEQDKWKEDFLLQIKSRGVPMKSFADDNQYHVWGLPFFNQNNRMEDFSDTFLHLTQK